MSEVERVDILTVVMLAGASAGTLALAEVQGRTQILLTLLMTAALLLGARLPGLPALWRYWQGRCLRRGMARGEIRPWYQPVITGARGQVTGCEVLARWVSPDGEVDGAQAFIPFAERSGLIVPLTRLLMRQVRRDLLSMAVHLPAGFEVSVNLSAAHAGSAAFLRDCRRLHRTLTGLGAHLCVEVTERKAFVTVPGGRLLLEALRRAGVKVMLDDFATGEQGLSGVDGLPVDGLKIDRCHVAEVPAGHVATMAEMIIRLATMMSLEVVAEGVESAEQHQWLLSKGVCRQQGYYFSRAVPADGLAVCLVAGFLGGGRR